MLTLKEWMELVDYRITEGCEFGWQCFGPNAHSLSSWNGDHDGYSFNIVFDTKDQTVYTVEACDYKHRRAFRMINPDYQLAYKEEGQGLNDLYQQAWDNVDFVDLDVDDDFIQKSLAIRNGEDYDTRVSIPVDFSDEELLKYMTLAHERDMTFNEFIEEALVHAMERYQQDPEAFAAELKETAKKIKK